MRSEYPPDIRSTESLELQGGNRGLQVRTDELRRRRSGLALSRSLGSNKGSRAESRSESMRVLQGKAVRGIGETARDRPKLGLTASLSLPRREVEERVAVRRALHEVGAMEDYIVRAEELASGHVVRTLHIIQSEHLADSGRVECIGKHWAHGRLTHRDRGPPTLLSVGAKKRNGLNGALQDSKAAADPWSMRWKLHEPTDPGVWASENAQDTATASTKSHGQICNHVERASDIVSPGLDDVRSHDIEVMFQKAHARLRSNERGDSASISSCATRSRGVMRTQSVG
jgi:hypothetical protein